MEGKDVPLRPEAVRDVRSRFRGDLLEPDGEGYDEERLVWNGMIDRRPAVVVRAFVLAQEQV